LKDCPYLVEAKRPKDWQPDPVIQKDIAQKLQKPQLKAAVDRAISRSRQGSPKESNEENSTPTAFTAFSVTDYQLRDSFILDSGADIHICNNRSRFHSFQEATPEDSIYAGNMTVPIDGFGSVYITIQAPKGPSKIELLKVAYISSFHTNIVSLRRLIAKNVHWDTRRDELTYQDQPFCQLQNRCNQWVMEYNEPQEKQGMRVFSARSVQPRKDSEATAAVWHRRLGHIGPETIDHLPSPVEGANLDKGPRTIDCEVCSVSKAHNRYNQWILEYNETKGAVPETLGTIVVSVLLPQQDHSYEIDSDSSTDEHPKWDTNGRGQTSADASYA
jgi:DNA polymerase III psi subunit